MFYQILMVLPKDILNIVWKKRSQLHYQDVINEYNKKICVCTSCSFGSIKKFTHCHLCNNNMCTRCYCFCKFYYKSNFAFQINYVWNYTYYNTSCFVPIFLLCNIFFPNKYLAPNKLVLLRIPIMISIFELTKKFVNTDIFFESHYYMTKFIPCDLLNLQTTTAVGFLFTNIYIFSWFTNKLYNKCLTKN